MAMPNSASEAGRTAPLDVKFIGDLQGCYMLSSRESGGDETVKVFGCRARSISPDMAVLQAPRIGEIGESLALKLNEIGMLRATISRRTPDGFVVDLLVSDAERAALAGRIDWMKRRHLHAITDRRENRRWLPRNPHSSMILAGGRQVDCFVVDVSASGAAISADVLPALGHPVVVGALLAKVVRHLECGFAVQFLTVQEPRQVEAQLMPPAEERSDLLAGTLEAAEAAIGSGAAVTAAAGPTGLSESGSPESR
jgi:hypothetical protein